MKPHGIFSGFFLSVLCLALPAAAAEQPAVIDLKKPVLESLRPDGFYWAFDEGIVGTSNPENIEDLSDNGITGLLGGSRESPTPTYADGKFGTAIYLQGAGSIVRWVEGNRTGSPMGLLTSGEKGKAFTAGIWFKMEDTKPVGHILMRRDGGARIGWRIALIKADSKDTETPGSSWNLLMEYGDYKGNPGTKATTDAFADGGWHHIGISVAPDGSAAESADGLTDFTAVYWLDGQLFDTVAFTTKEVDVEQGSHSIVVGNDAWGIADDAFITSGVHSFKK
ncbi:MAG: hypothetical protein WCQ57_00640 [Verrucomicrobiota bacterium]